MKDTTIPHRSARRHRQVLLLILLALPWMMAASSSRPARRPAHRAMPVNLVWHVETLDGTEVSTIQGNEPINPASVVKVATTLWALEKLGPEHRFDTVFATPGTPDETKGVLAGDLIVLGNGDPDFHAENAFLVALRLNELGIRTVRGSLRVNNAFWIGWEGGTGRVITDPRIRGEQMAQRLRAALDPKRWNGTTRRAWRDFAIRRGLPTTRPPGKHSGRHAFRERVQQLGFSLSDDELNRAFTEFKKLADRKKEMFDADIEAIVMNSEDQASGPWQLEELHITAGTGTIAAGAVRLKHADGRVVNEAAVGDGPIEASCKSLERGTGLALDLKNFEVRSVTMGEDAQGEVTVTVEYNGQSHRGHGISTDIVEAGALAYLDVINRICRRAAAPGREPVHGTGHVANL